MPIAIATPTETDKPPRRRRWIPLSLRMFVVMLMLGGCSSALLFGVSAYQQQAAVQEIERIGGVTYRTETAGPAWLKNFVGEERIGAFDQVYRVSFRPRRETYSKRSDWDSSGHTPWTEGNIEVDDSSLACIRKLPKLKELNLDCTNVGDGGIANVAMLRELESLAIGGTDVSDASIPLLKSLTKLKDLHLYGTEITRAGVAELKRALPGLQVYR